MVDLNGGDGQGLNVEHEAAGRGAHCVLDAESANRLKFDNNGLIPVLVQDYKTGKALTLAYMNAESLDISIRERRTCFYSRSRRQLWRKGETSGNTQRIVSIMADCDYDALVVEVEPTGPACHTGQESCFHNLLYENRSDAEMGLDVKANPDAAAIAAAPAGNAVAAAAPAGNAVAAAAPAAIAAAPAAPPQGGFSLRTLYDIIAARKAERPEGSYTSYLFNKGIEKILKKVGEESSEVIIASMKRNREETIYETADLCYHLLVLLCESGIEPEEIIDELSGRHVKNR